MSAATPRPRRPVDPLPGLIPVFCILATAAGMAVGYALGMLRAIGEHLP